MFFLFSSSLTVRRRRNEGRGEKKEEEKRRKRMSRRGGGRELQSQVSWESGVGRCAALSSSAVVPSASPAFHTACFPETLKKDVLM